MEPEGVIRFNLKLVAAPPLPEQAVAEIEAWRHRLRKVGLLGQDPDRYDGYGFGNISRRLAPFAGPPTARRFLITGSQTGHLATLQASHYVVICACDPAHNFVEAEGGMAPSSESLTHGVLYALDDRIRWVVHAHAPTIWRRAAQLSLPVTDRRVQQGTPAMYKEVARLMAVSDVLNQRLFAMGGHEDGMIAFGRTAQEAGDALFARL